MQTVPFYTLARLKILTTGLIVIVMEQVLFLLKNTTKQFKYILKNSMILVMRLREKQLKNWHRDWKWNLVKVSNPELKDLYTYL